jgi:hypothetical protein
MGGSQSRCGTTGRGERYSASAGNRISVVQPVASSLYRLKPIQILSGLPLPLWSWDSSVVQRWAAGWMIGGSSPGRGWEFLSSPPHSDRLWGPPSLLSNGYHGLSLGVKLPGREADHSPPSSPAEVKSAWSCNSTPPVRLHGAVLS